MTPGWAKVQILVFFLALSLIACQTKEPSREEKAAAERLNEVEERLELIGSLTRKYGDSIEAILAHRDDAAVER